MFPVDIAKLLRIAFLYNTSGDCFWQYYHGTVKSAGMPVAWIDWSHALDFRICFGKTLIAFDEKLTQGVAQVTM